MSKLDIPVFKYLAQDEEGDIFCYVEEPIGQDDYWLSDNHIGYMAEGKQNPDWQKTLIDLEKDDYEFEDGILRRIEK